MLNQFSCVYLNNNNVKQTILYWLKLACKRIFVCFWLFGSINWFINQKVFSWKVNLFWLLSKDQTKLFIYLSFIHWQFIFLNMLLRCLNEFEYLFMWTIEWPINSNNLIMFINKLFRFAQFNLTHTWCGHIYFVALICK